MAKNIGPYTIGLDIGIGSVGWAVLRNDPSGEPYKIENLGVRIFTCAEDPDTGASLAAPRRQARSVRRILRRRKLRKLDIRRQIERMGIMTRPDMEILFEKSSFEKEVHELRVLALDRILTAEEAARLLVHYSQGRGYRSNSRSEEEKDEEAGKVKTAISANRKIMEEHGYRTVGEMLWLDEAFREITPDGEILHTVHNKGGDYRVTVERAMLEEEIRLMFAKQREFGAAWATEKNEEEYIGIWGRQRSFDEGPGKGSPYGGDMIARMWGRCTYEPDEPRAPRGSFSAEYYTALQFVNNLRLVNGRGASRLLNAAERQKAMDLIMNDANANYTKLRKALAMQADERFNMLRYDDKKKLADTEKKNLGQMKFYHELNKKLEGKAELDKDERDILAMVLACYKTDAKRTDRLTQYGFTPTVIDAVLGLSTAGDISLSVKALKKLIPHLEEGELVHEAIAAEYPAQEKTVSEKLRIEDAGEINNPVVRRAVSQTIKVINAIVREYGEPETVRVELAREVGKPFELRNDILKKQEKNRKANEAAIEQIKAVKGPGARVTGLDIVKFKLFNEQGGICLYSGQNLDASRLYEAGYVDIDHIVPYSISFDDTYHNKVLVLASENRQKGNRIPYQYLASVSQARADAFEVLVNSGMVHLSPAKRRKLLARTLSGEQIEGFKQRNLVDTQYMARVVYRLIEEHLAFRETGNYKKKTQTVNGAITSEVRKRLGIEKIREDGDLHHARDAAVIACITPGLVHKITDYSKHREMAYSSEGFIDYATGEILSRDDYDKKFAPEFPAPWPQFRRELDARLSERPDLELDALQLDTYEGEPYPKAVTVSRMPRHKVTGAGHMETIRSMKVPGHFVSKVPLEKLKLDKNGEITNYYEPQSDRLLYEALKARLALFGGDGEKAFKGITFRKPRADGSEGPVVKKVKLVEPATMQVGLNKDEEGTPRGGADNGGMVRLDVFYVEGDGYYYVPIYYADTKKKELPNKAAVAYKPYEQWKDMKEEDFVFSMYAGDMIRIESKKPIQMAIEKGGTGEKIRNFESPICYFAGFNINTGALKVTTHDRRYAQQSLGGKSLLRITKYQVDILGNVSPAPIETRRQTFERTV